MKSIINTKLYIIIGLTITVIAVIIYFTILNKASVKIVVIPKNAQVLLNNKPEAVNNSGIAKFKKIPGKYTLRVEANGYVPYQKIITLKGGSSFSSEINLSAIPKLMSLRDNVTLTQKYEDNQITYLTNNRSTLSTSNATLNSDNQPEAIGQKDLTPAVFANIDSIKFAPDNQLALVQRGNDLFLYDFNRYDILHQEMRQLGSNIGDAIWSPDQSRIAYTYSPSSGERSLILSDVLNTNPQRVLALGDIENPILYWAPGGDQILIVPQNSDVSLNKIYLFNISTRELTALTDFGNVLDARFISDGQKIVYFTGSNDPEHPIKSDVSIMDTNGNNKTDLKIKAYPENSFITNDNSMLLLTYLSGEEKIAYFDASELKFYQVFFEKPANFKIQNLILSNDQKLLFVAGNNNLYVTNFVNNKY